MKTLYIDESGSPELSSKDKYVVLCGVIIDEDNESNFQFILNSIKTRYNLSFTKHIHAVEIFEQKDALCYLGRTAKRRKKDLRPKFRDEIWDVIRRYDLKYFSVCVPKVLVRKFLYLHKYSDDGKSWISSGNFYAKVDNQLPLDVGVNAIYHWAIRQLKGDEKLKIVFESRSGDPFTIRNFNLVSVSNNFKNRHLVKFATKLKDSVVSIAFANKGVKSAGLEFADIVSYTCNMYFLQHKKNTSSVDGEVKKSLLFKGIHKTLNWNHYQEIGKSVVRKYIPGLIGRTKRIANHYENRRRKESLFSESRQGGSPVHTS